MAATRARPHEKNLFAASWSRCVTSLVHSLEAWEQPSCWCWVCCWWWRLRAAVGGCGARGPATTAPGDPTASSTSWRARRRRRCASTPSTCCTASRSRAPWRSGGRISTRAATSSRSRDTRSSMDKARRRRRDFPLLLSIRPATRRLRDVSFNQITWNVKNSKFKIYTLNLMASQRSHL